MSGNIKAFPSAEGYPNLLTECMYLRDYFAAKALTGILDFSSAGSYDMCDDAVKIVAKTAYRLADAMLKARNANHE